MIPRSLLVLGLVTLVTGSRHRQGLRAPPPTGRAPPPEQWITQRLDHFRVTEQRTWRQRYWVNWAHYTPGGPALLMIGGEGEANPAWMEAGAWTTYAKETGAAMLLLEHRFYGKSHPTPDLGVKNLVWLSSRQALADLANFITQMEASHNLTGPWVALGGSYPGSLAAWLRLKYPHLVAGSVSTSGPLLAKADFYEYLEVVTASLDTVTGCVPALRKAVKRLGELLEDGKGCQYITNKFRLCSPLDRTNTNDVINLYESLIGNFEGIVQYNKDNKAFEGAQWGNVTIDTVCDILVSSNTGPVTSLGDWELDGLAGVNDLTLMMTDQTCLDHTYESEVRFEFQTSILNLICTGQQPPAEQLGLRRRCRRAPVDLPDLHRVWLVSVIRCPGLLLG